MGETLTSLIIEALYDNPDEMIDLLIDDIDRILDLIVQVPDKRVRSQRFISVIKGALYERSDHPVVDTIIDYLQDNGVQARRLSELEYLDKENLYPEFVPGKKYDYATGLVSFGPILIALESEHLEARDDDVVCGAEALCQMRNPPPSGSEVHGSSKYPLAHRNSKMARQKCM